MGKRILGFLNWHRKRKYIHLVNVLELIVDDLRRQQPDHIVVTGDLVNISTSLEFDNARRWLSRLGTAEHVTVIPGNHDAYVPMPPGKGMDQLHEYMTDNPRGKYLVETDSLRDFQSEGFPFVRCFGNIALIGLRSGIPTPPFMATGTLGQKQLNSLRKTLFALSNKNLFRIILIHHPPLPGQTSWSRALRDTGALIDVLKEAGGELILFGHRHIQSFDSLEATGCSISVLGAPSASRGIVGSETLARYNLLRINTDSHECVVEMTGRGLRTEGGAVEELEKHIVFRRSSKY